MATCAESSQIGGNHIVERHIPSDSGSQSSVAIAHHDVFGITVDVKLQQLTAAHIAIVGKQREGAALLGIHFDIFGGRSLDCHITTLSQVPILLRIDFAKSFDKFFLKRE